MTHINPTPAPTKPTKAIVGAVAAGVVAGLSTLATALADGVVSSLEWVLVVSAVIVGSGITGGTVYGTTNAPKD